MTAGKRGMGRGLTSYGDDQFSLFLRKAFIKGLGLGDDALSRPLIGIANTASGYNACHGNVPDLIEAVKRGVMLAGGLAVPFPTISRTRALPIRRRCICATCWRWIPRK